MTGQKAGLMKPVSPARWRVMQVVGGCPEILTAVSGLVTREVGSNGSHTLQAGKPGDGGIGTPTGEDVTGAAVTGAAVTGEGVAGAAVTGAAVTGEGVAGAAVTGSPSFWHPHGPTTPGISGQKSSSIKPMSPARWRERHVVGGDPVTSTMASGMVIRTELSSLSQTLQGGNPGDGGIGPITGALVGAGVAGTTSQPQGPVRLGSTGQFEASMNPPKPARSRSPQLTGGSPGNSRMTPGSITRSNSPPQTLHCAKPGLGGIGAATNTGALVVGAAVKICAHSQPPVRAGRIGQADSSMNPSSPANCRLPHDTGGWSGISSMKLLLVTRSVPPQMLHGGKPGLGGVGPATKVGPMGENVKGAPVTGAGVTGASVMTVGIGVTGAGVTGAAVTGAGVTGAGVTGAGVTGAGVTGAGVTGAGVTGAPVTGELVTGAGVTGAGVTGAGVTGAGVTGAGVTGAGVTGAGVTGASVTVISTGAAVTGAGVTGAGVTGAGVTGAGVTGANVFLLIIFFSGSGVSRMVG